MRAITRVIGPVDPEAARWAGGLNEPAAGRLAIIVPPGLPSLAALVGELLGALGKPADRNPRGTASADILELGLAWLAGHAIDRIVLVHADWLSEAIASELCTFATLAGVDLACVVGDRHLDPFVEWATAEQAWFAFVAEETAAAASRDLRAAEPAGHQGDRVGRLGRPTGQAIVLPAAELVGAALAAYLAVAARIRLEGTTEASIANSLRQVLRTFASAELPDAARGAAAALAKAGWALRFDGASQAAQEGPRWADLRTSVYPYQAAAVGLVAAGIWANDLPAVLVGDVAEDGATVRLGGHELPVPPGARPYLIAQRRLAVNDSAAFLTCRGRGLTPHAAEGAVLAVMAEAGHKVDGGLLYPARTPGLRWLAARGLSLQRAEVAGEPMRMEPRCRHGLAAAFEVDGVVLGHSHRLCRTEGPADQVPWQRRPAAAGFDLEELERTDWGVRMAVRRDGAQAGEIVAISISEGLLWVQVGVGEAPPLQRIARVIAERYGIAVASTPAA